MKIHHTSPYLLNPPHKISVDLVGIGGTGSQMITCLARINEALVALGQPGLHVRSWDNDVVTEANIGRQMFSTADLGMNKAMVLTTRVNRFFGYEWEAIPGVYGGQDSSNILITCVDSAKARVMLGWKIENGKYEMRDPVKRRFYWLDIGNTQKTGQCVLGTFYPLQQPTKIGTKAMLPTVTKKFPQLKKMMGKDEDSGPSCSLAEALEKQDLFINSTLAQFGAGLIWKLLREGKISHHGCYVNLETLNVNPIKIG